MRIKPRALGRFLMLYTVVFTTCLVAVLWAMGEAPEAKDALTVLSPLAGAGIAFYAKSGRDDAEEVPID